MQRHTHCYAPGCRTGYTYTKTANTVSLFSVPGDPAARKIWERNLCRADRALGEKSAVCELHFEPRFVLRDYIHIIDGKEVRVPRGRPALARDAVPTLLPNVPQHFSTRVPSAAAETTTSSGERVQQAGIPSSTGTTAEGPVPTSEELSPQALCRLHLPTPYWTLHRFTNFDGVAYLTTALDRDTNRVSVEREVLYRFDKLPDVLCQIHVLGQLVGETTVRTFKEAERALHRAASIHFCSGALSDAELKTTGLTLTERFRLKCHNREGVIYSNDCLGRGAHQDGRCLQCKYLRKAVQYRKSKSFTRKLWRTMSPAQKHRASLERDRQFKSKVYHILQKALAERTAATCKDVPKERVKRGKMYREPF